MHLVFMLEERSAQELLDQLLPRILPAGVTHTSIPHRGKSDLRKSLPRKLRSWLNPDTVFIVLHDQDSHEDCRVLKQELVALCNQAGRPDTLVRIVCRELEAWYFGDLAALEQAYPGTNLVRLEGRAKYRDPDAIPMPARELRKLLPEFQKVSGAAKIGAYMRIDENRSRSFGVFVEGLRRLCAEGRPA